MATKPLVSTEWATQVTTAGGSGNINKDEPTQAFKDFGQPEASPVDRQSLNYELNALDQWRAYFEVATDDLQKEATTTVKGLVELATPAELETGNDLFRVVPVKTLSDKLKTYQEKGYLVLSGGGNLTINRKHIITDANTYTLPSPSGLQLGDRVVVTRLGDAVETTTPVTQVNGAGNEKINYYKPSTGILEQVDTSVLFNTTQELEFLFNTDWEL